MEGQQGIKLATYGRGKTGKTRLATTFPKPILIIGTEDGTKSICTGKRPLLYRVGGTWIPAESLAEGATPEGTVYSLLNGGKETGVAFVRIDSPGWVDELVGLREPMGLKSYCLDHGSGLYDLTMKEVLGMEEIPIQKGWGMADRATWGAIGQQTCKHFRRLLDMADRYGTNVVIITHERNFKDDEGGASDLIAPTIGPALSPKACAWLNGAVDYICQTYIAPVMAKTSIKVGNEMQEQQVPTGKFEYRLRVGTHSVFMTGFRLPDGQVLPEYIVNPTYEKVLALIQGKVA